MVRALGTELSALRLTSAGSGASTISAAGLSVLWLPFAARHAPIASAGEISPSPGTTHAAGSATGDRNAPATFPIASSDHRR